MLIYYDASGDTLTITLSSVKPRYGDDQHPDVVLHVSEDGRIAMIEINGASHHLVGRDLIGYSPDGLLSLAEAGAIANRNPGTLRLLCERGRLKGLKIGRNWLTTKAWLDQYLKNRRGQRAREKRKGSHKFTHAKAL